MNNPYFYQYESDKWDWTTSAVTKFRNGFNRFDLNTDTKEQVFIGVYGPTQVGKTTFILTLLGIAYEHLNVLSDKLRGGRAKGKSATVTCTIFQRATGDAFEIFWPSGESFICSDLNEVEIVMSRLRQSIYDMNIFSVEPLIIKIPDVYFNLPDVDQRVRDLSIIDLPGDDSKDLQEMQHIDRILKEYIARCKVCIIMEISSQLTALTKLDKEIVKNWFDLPQQFRIVLTRSISNSSIMNEITTNKITSVQQFKDTYYNELNRVCVDGDLETKLYPLEFGDSWMDLEDHYPYIFQTASVWLREIYRELIDDLTNIYSPEQEIKKLKSLERFIERGKEQEINSLVQELNVLKLEEVALRQNCLAYEKIINKESQILEQMKEHETKWCKLNLELQTEITLPVWSSLIHTQKKASYLKAQFYGLQKDLLEEAQEIERNLSALLKTGKYHSPLNLNVFIFPEDIFDKILYFDYLTDRYLRKSKYIDDRYYALQKIEKTIIDFHNSVLDYRKKSLEEVRKSIQNQKAKVNSLKKAECSTTKKHKNKMLCLQKKLESIKVVESEWEMDKNRSRELDLFLMESFTSKSKEYIQMIKGNEISKEEKWYVHQYWNVMKRQAERLIDYDK